MCLTASSLATGGFKFKSFQNACNVFIGLQSCLFKYITVAAFHIYAQRGEDGAKRGEWRPCIK